MKTLFILGLLSPMAMAAPFIVSDPYPATAVQPQTCQMDLDGAVKPAVAVAKNASNLAYCKFDITGITAGSHTVKAKALASDPVWGALESVWSVPFTFTKPNGTTDVPTGLKLSPQ